MRPRRPRPRVLAGHSRLSIAPTFLPDPSTPPALAPGGGELQGGRRPGHPQGAGPHLLRAALHQARQGWAGLSRLLSRSCFLGGSRFLSGAPPSASRVGEPSRLLVCSFFYGQALAASFCATQRSSVRKGGGALGLAPLWRLHSVLFGPALQPASTRRSTRCSIVGGWLGQPAARHPAPREHELVCGQEGLGKDKTQPLA